MRAQDAYKADKHARPTHAHTPTNNSERYGGAVPEIM